MFFIEMSGGTSAVRKLKPNCKEARMLGLILALFIGNAPTDRELELLALVNEARAKAKTLGGDNRQVAVLSMPVMECKYEREAEYVSLTSRQREHRGR